MASDGITASARPRAGAVSLALAAGIWDRLWIAQAGGRADGSPRHDEQKRPSTKAALLWFAVNKLAINLSSDLVDNQYFKVLVVPQAVVAEILRHLFAVRDRFSVRFELNAEAVSVRNAVFHIEKKLLHVGPRSRVLANLRDHAPVTNLMRGSVFAAPDRMGSQPCLILEEGTHRMCHLPMFVTGGPG
jgi:hypothetical protein